MRNIDSVLTLIKNRKWDQSGGGGDEGTSQRGDSYFILYEFSSRIEYYGASYLEINQHLQMHLKLSVLVQTRLNRVSWTFKNTMFHPPQSAPGKVFCHMWQKKKKIFQINIQRLITTELYIYWLINFFYIIEVH